MTPILLRAAFGGRAFIALLGAASADPRVTPKGLAGEPVVDGRHEPSGRCARD
jgi:hypothetical protein